MKPQIIKQPPIEKTSRNIFTKKNLQKKLPILTWLPKYDLDSGIGDLVAGITIALTIIPQALAYSNIVKVPTQNGLYSSFMGCFVYIILGNCKDASIGPTATLSLITFQFIQDKGAAYSTLVCFLTGIVQIVMGALGLGFLTNFISEPVSSGFTSAVALMIVTSQLKYILSVDVAGTTFLSMWTSLIQDIRNVNWNDTILGVACIVVLLLMRLLQNFQIGPNEEKYIGERKNPSVLHKVVNKILWFVCISRNAVVVVLCAFISSNFLKDGKPAFTVIGHVPPGLPTVQLPPFSYTEMSKETNGTEIHHDFLDMIQDIGAGIIVIPLVALLENIAVCKAFAKGKSVDASQELIALGASNLANSFVQGFPVTGALARSALNNSSGVRTTFGGFYTSILVIISLSYFTPYFYYIPKASLAALIVAAVIFMIEYHVVKPIWNSNRNDLIPGVITFLSCLILPLEYGILIGIGVNVLFILYHTARPKISVEKIISSGGTEYLMLTPDRCLIFPSVDYVKYTLTKYSLRQEMPVVINCTFIYKADYTAGIAVDTLVKDFAARGQPLLFFNLKRSVSSVFAAVCSENIIAYYDENDIDDCLRNNSEKCKESLMVCVDSTK